MTDNSSEPSFEEVVRAEVRGVYYRGIEIARKFGPDYNEDALRDKYIDWQEEHILEAHNANKAKARLEEVDAAIVKCPCELGDCSLCEYLMPRRDELAALIENEAQGRQE